VRAGAVAEGVPTRDLWLSPGHALFIDGTLIAVEHLINGLTVTQSQDVDFVEYFHIELDTHDVLFAEGAAAESYVECDNRNGFHNAAEFARLYPDDDRPSFAYCAPRLEAGMAELGTIRQKLLDQAEALGHVTTDDPDLHLLIDGAVLRAAAIEDGRYTFVLEEKPGELRLASRTAIPAEMEPLSSDRRHLGVCIEKIVLHDDHLRLQVGHSHPALRDGFHDDEGVRRWTDGMAQVPAALLAPFSTGFTIEVHCLPTRLRYGLNVTAEPAPSSPSLIARVA